MVDWGDGISMESHKDTKFIAELCNCENVQLHELRGVITVICPHFKPRYFRNGIEVFDIKPL